MSKRKRRYLDFRSQPWLSRWSRVFFFLLTVALGSCQNDTATSATNVCAPGDLTQQLFASPPSDTTPIQFQRIEDAGEFSYIGPEAGGSFTARTGDYLIETDQLRAVIQQPSRQHFIGNYGGNLIDVDVQRADNVWHDVLGEVALLIGLSYTIDAQQIDVLPNTPEGTLVVRASGPLAILDYINVPAFADIILSGLVDGTGELKLNLPWDLDAGIEADATIYYVFKSGSPVIEIHTALCNTGDSVLLTSITDFIDSGGTVSPFNSNLRIEDEPGFGIELSIDGLDASADIVGFRGASGGYALRAAGPSAFMGYAGIGILGHGMTDVPDFLVNAILGFDHTQPPPGYYRLEPGQTLLNTRQMFVFRDDNELTRGRYTVDETPDVVDIEGTVRDSNGGIDGARIAFINTDDKIETLFTTDAGGAFDGKIRSGSYTAIASRTGQRIDQTQTARFGGQGGSIGLTLPDHATLSFSVRGTDSTLGTTPVALPAKVSLVCPDDCERNETRLFTDTLYDSFADDLLLQAMVDIAGKVSVMAKRGRYRQDTLAVPPGTYELVVSRGMDYTVFRRTITAVAGEDLHIDAWLERVIERQGYISADLHVHTVNSHDSPVPLNDRVLTFAAEGVDVVVSTDHDYITDLGPVIEDQGLSDYLASMIGEELTFTDIGHFNAYPLQPDPDKIQNGALDGAGGRGPTLAPAQFFAGLDELGAIDDPVIQINHGRSLLFGYFAAIGLDSTDLSTTAQPELFRMNPDAVTADGNDTGLFSEGFDVFELYNSYSEINAGLNDLFAFLNLGLRKTGVAVSDTHQWYSTPAGVPRTLLRVGSAHDNAQELDEVVFARALQAGKAIGTNGPLLELTVRNSDNKTATVGETIAGKRFDVTVKATMPEWVRVDTLDLFSNTPDTASRNGDVVNTYPKTLFSRQVSTAEFTTIGGVRTVTWTTTVEIDSDSWLVAVARDSAEVAPDYPMFPVIKSKGSLPFAYTNAVFMDADGNGQFDAPGPQGQAQTGGGDVPSFAPLPSDQTQRREVLKRRLADTLPSLHQH